MLNNLLRNMIENLNNYKNDINDIEKYLNVDDERINNLIKESWSSIDDAWLSLVKLLDEVKNFN